MTSIKTYIFSICLAAIIASVVQMLLPSGSSSKVMKTLIAIFFLCVIIAPFSGTLKLENDLFVMNKPASFEMKTLSDAMYKQIEEAAAIKIKENINNSIMACNINNAKISIFMDTTASGRITISKVEIYLNKADMSRKTLVENVIKRQLGLDAYVEEVKNNE